MTLFIAMLCSAISFTVQWREQWLPEPPEPERIAWEHNRSWFHNMKNLTTETIRADAEFWSKALLFVIVVQFLVIVALFIVKR